MGTLRKRGETWTYQIFLKDANSKSKFITKGGFKSQREAKNAMRELENEIQNNGYINEKKIKLSDFLDQWIESYKNNISLPSTQYYQNIINRINKYMANTIINEITPYLLQNIYTKMKNNNESNWYISKCHRVLHLALKHAKMWQLIKDNPCENVTPPRYKSSNKPKVWTEDEVNQFLNLIRGKRIYLPVLLAVTTGMRRGEICALQWDDVNFETGYISISKNFQYDQKKHTQNLDLTKTNTSNRSITITNKLILELKKLRQFQLELKLKLGNMYNDQKFVFADEKGDPMKLNYLTQTFANEIKDNNFKNRIPFHGLRHTHATILLSKNINPKIVQERLGHSTVSITMDIYSHVTPNMQKEVSEKIENMFV